jgi:hypothetical protein
MLVIILDLYLKNIITLMIAPLYCLGNFLSNYNEIFLTRLFFLISINNLL